jgi:hypothetical protein
MSTGSRHSSREGSARIGVRLGNWLTPEQGRRLLESAAPSTARQLRDYAMVAMLIGCGLRRAELLALRLESIQQREEHWVDHGFLLGLRIGRVLALAGWSCETFSSTPVVSAKLAGPNGCLLDAWCDEQGAHVGRQLRSSGQTLDLDAAAANVVYPAALLRSHQPV